MVLRLIAVQGAVRYTCRTRSTTEGQQGDRGAAPSTPQPTSGRLPRGAEAATLRAKRRAIRARLHRPRRTLRRRARHSVRRLAAKPHDRYDVGGLTVVICSEQIENLEPAHDLCGRSNLARGSAGFPFEDRPTEPSNPVCRAGKCILAGGLRLGRSAHASKVRAIWLIVLQPVAYSANFI
jgi:hypothetical protein